MSTPDPAAAWPVTLQELEDRLARALTGPLPGPEAQQVMAPVPRPNAPWPDPGPTREAAVLLLVYPGAEGLTVPLTVRAGTLAHHGGQISLPGGGVDPGETLEEAALREATEEVGIDPATVRLVGRLTPLHIPVSGNTLQPIVGVSDCRPDFAIDAREVDCVIETPLCGLLDPLALRRETRLRDGLWVDYPYFDLHGRQLWGATAMVMAEFLALLGWARWPASRPPSAGHSRAARNRG